MLSPLHQLLMLIYAKIGDDVVSGPSPLAPLATVHSGAKTARRRSKDRNAPISKPSWMRFASGTRHNDINQQMRQIARALSPAERDSVAERYGNEHSE